MRSLRDCYARLWQMQGNNITFLHTGPLAQWLIALQPVYAFTESAVDLQQFVI